MERKVEIGAVVKHKLTAEVAVVEDFRWSPDRDDAEIVFFHDGAGFGHGWWSGDFEVVMSKAEHEHYLEVSRGIRVTLGA